MLNWIFSVFGSHNNMLIAQRGCHMVNDSNFKGCTEK